MKENAGLKGSVVLHHPHAIRKDFVMPWRRGPSFDGKGPRSKSGGSLDSIENKIKSR
jgi:hypothetical protein